MLILLLAGLIAYFNSFTVPFLFDDSLFILDPRSQEFFTPLWNALLPQPHQQVWVYRPLVTFTLGINFHLNGLQPLGYHAFNLALHLANGLLLFALLRRAIGRGPGLAVALLWLVHPVQTEAVTFIYQRAETLMALAALLTLYGLTRAAESPGKKRWEWLAVAACALGMTGKQTMIVVPVLALLYDRALLAGSWREVWQKRGRLHVALLATWGVLLSMLAIGYNQLPTNSGFGYTEVTPLRYLLTMPGVLVYYIKLAFWPHPLVIDYLWPHAYGFWAIAPPAIAVLALLGLTAWSTWRRPRLGFLGIWFFLPLAPVSSFVPCAAPIAEHRLYLPLGALLTLTVLAAARLLKHRRPLAIGLTAAAALALTTGTVLRNRDYRSPLALWKDTVTKRPKHFMARNNLANAYAREGNWELALKEMEEALRSHPEHPILRKNYEVIRQAATKRSRLPARSNPLSPAPGPSGTPAGLPESEAP